VEAVAMDVAGTLHIQAEVVVLLAAAVRFFDCKKAILFSMGDPETLGS
jgi:hypothetical protein